MPKENVRLAKVFPKILGQPSSLKQLIKKKKKEDAALDPLLFSSDTLSLKLIQPIFMQKNRYRKPA